jgi:hypothetical protein
MQSPNGIDPGSAIPPGGITADRLAELRLEWEERWERGENPTVEELCVDSPELASAAVDDR